MSTIKEPTVDFGGRVPESLYNRFIELCPQYGATTWFVRASLEAFLDETEKDPSAQQKIVSAINRMVTINKEP